MIQQPVCLVRREGLRGPGIATATALDGTQIVCVYPATQDQQVLHVHYPLLTGAERDMLDEQLARGNVMNIAGFSCIPAEKSGQNFEPIFGDYPENAPERLRLWRANLKFYIVRGSNGS